MKLTKLQIGKVVTPNNVFLAPMAGYTDYCFRHLIIPMGVGLAFTELVSAKGLVYGGNGSKDLLFSGEDLASTSVQLFGSDPYYLRKACESQDLKDFNIIDINMGCPVPKVYKNGEGSALLTDIKKAENIVKECVKSGKIITIKIRTGLTHGDDVATDYCKMAENSGASAVTIHGRVREDYYSGEIEFNAIEKAKKSVHIPIIANGGIFTEQDADIVMDRTGADGVMIARGALADPTLIAKLVGNQKAIDNFNLKEFMIAHLKLMVDRYGERKAVSDFRKFIPYYLKSKLGIKPFKVKIQTENDYLQVIKLIEEIL